MLHANRLLISTLLLAPLSMGQNASVNVRADAGHQDTRPFGKYLVEICTFSGDESRLGSMPEAYRKLTCSRIKKNADQHAYKVQLENVDQAITLKLVCDPGKKESCDTPTYPLLANTDFFVSATADSGRPVHQTVLSGNATRLGGAETVRYRANRVGSIVIRASQTEVSSSKFRAAGPVDLILQVSEQPEKSTKPCSVLPAPTPTPTSSPFLDATGIVTLLGNPTPFLLSAPGSNTIAIYSTREPLSDKERTILDSFQNSIVTLAGHTANSLGVTAPSKPFTVELAIPHASALGDLAARVNSLNYSQFTVQNVGSERIRVTSSSQPDCDIWTNFLTDIRRMTWQLVSDPMNKKLFYLSSSDVAAGFSSLSSSGSSSPSGSGSSTSPASTGGSSGSPSSPSGSSPSGGAASASNATISITQPPGSNVQVSSDTTPCVVAGLAFGNTNACAPPAATSSSSSGGGAGSGPSAPSVAAAKPSINMASVSVAMGTGEQSPPDLLVFSDTNPGDDALIEERLRVIAQLDLPRPEMIINAWVTQNSSASPGAMGAFTNLVNQVVADYNKQFENVVLRGWDSVKFQSTINADYWNEAFRSYVEDHFAADQTPEKDGTTAQEMSQSFLSGSKAKLAETIATDSEVLVPGFCPQKRYCLGYNSLFHPLKPALTDLLLTIIAAKNPLEVFDVAIGAVESGNEQITKPEADAFSDAQGAELNDLRETDCENGSKAARDRCHKIWDNLSLDRVSSMPFQRRSCVDMDYRGILRSLMQDNAHEPRVYLYCLREEIHRLLKTAPNGRVYGAGFLRAAVADFLFNYKISQQYPHEFTPYDLTHTADALNNALNPIIDAFNRDLAAYQIFVRADMQYLVDRLNSEHDGRCCVKRLFGIDKPSFFNDGLITVRTISGQLTSVATTSQSVMNISTAPQLSALLNSITGASSSGQGNATQTANTQSSNSQGGGSGSSGQTKTASSNSPAAPVLPSGLSLLASVLANYQTTSAQIGRSLQITASPRSLSTASSAEISVTLNADESASPALYSTGATNDPSLLTSRVANHDTTTRVRIDSVKLFEISSLTAILQGVRSRLPLLPPFVEIPYIGTLAGIPLGAAKEFHNSTAIISAYVVPTAADVAYGLRFDSDLVVDGLNPGPCSLYKGAAGPEVKNVCVFHRALSLHDFGAKSLRNFNKAMVRCLANDAPVATCGGIRFDDVPQ
jgi:hypothetical protein